MDEYVAHREEARAARIVSILTNVGFHGIYENATLKPE